MFTKEDIRLLERFLLRAKGQATSERNEANRLWGAYGDRRDSLGYQLEGARKDIADAERLLELVKTIPTED
jgi:hypothetical protein